MKVNTVKSSVILGMLLLGSSNLIFAQATDSASAQKTQTARAQVQDNDALVKQAVSYQDQKDWANALATWKKVSTNLPDWAPAYYSQGYVYQSMKDNANALSSYEKYIEKIKPEEIEASKANLAYAHLFIAYSLSQTDKAAAKLQIAKSLAYDPSNEDAKKLSEALNQ